MEFYYIKRALDLDMKGRIINHENRNNWPRIAGSAVKILFQIL